MPVSNIGMIGIKEQYDSLIPIYCAVSIVWMDACDWSYWQLNPETLTPVTPPAQGVWGHPLAGVRHTNSPRLSWARKNCCNIDIIFSLS